MRTSTALVAWLAVGLFTVPVHDAIACGAMSRSGTPLRTVAESAVIVWDEAKHEERFVRRASFQHGVGESSDMAFLVPTPTAPVLEEVDNAAFETLENFVNDKLVVYTNEGGGGGGGCGDNSMGAGDGTSRSTGVEVVSSTRVGGQDATVLRATDSAALQLWLTQHGFTITPAESAYLQRYVDNGWYLTAFRYAGNDGSAQIDIRAVSMRFGTPTPFYPYREAASTSTEERSLSVYTIASTPMKGTLGLGDEAWTPGKVRWSGKIDDATQAQLPSTLGVPVGATLTAFEDLSSPRQGVDEVYFKAAPATGTTASRVIASPFGLLALVGVVWSRKRRRSLTART